MFLRELGALHFVFHPTDHRTATAPGELWVLLAAILGRNLGALKRVASARRATAANGRDCGHALPEEPQLLLQIGDFRVERRLDLVAKFDQGVDRHRSEAISR